MTAPGGGGGATSTAHVQAVLDFADLDRQFAARLADAATRAERDFQRHLAGITRAAQGASRDIGRSFDGIDTRGVRRGLDQAADAADEAGRDIDRSMERAGQSMDDAGESAGAFRERVSGMAAAAAAAGAGALGLAGAMDLVAEAMNRANLANRLGAQLDLTAEEAAQAGQIAGQVYAQNYGDSMETVTEATGAVLSSLASLSGDGAGAVEDLTKRVATLGDTFGVEAGEIAQSANVAIRNGFAGNAVEALDMLGAAFQRVPAQMRDELLPLFDEYGTYFSGLGFDGQTAFGMIVGAAQRGAIEMDKVGDAIKEFGIRATDIGDTGAQEAMTALGLDAVAMSNALLAGGDSAQSAFSQIIDGLLAIEDPGEQAAAAIALFGTPLEDLDKTKIPEFLAGLSSGASEMANFTGTVDEMGAHLATGPGAALELLKRQVEESLLAGLGQAATLVQSNVGVFQGLGVALVALGAAYGVVRLAAVASAVSMGIHAAATGADTAAIAANRVALGAHAVASAVMRGATLAGAAATGVATAATWAFNAAMAVLTAPITLVILAIGAFVAALVLLYQRNETFRNFVQTAWAAIQSAVGVAWEFIKGVFSALVGWITGSLVPTLQSWWGIAQQVFSAVGALVTFWWSTVVQPILNNFVTLIRDFIVPAVLWFWHNVMGPAFEQIGALISFWWQNIVGPAFDGVKLAIGILGDAFTWWWQNIVTPVFEGAKSVISGWWSGVSTVFDTVKSAIGTVGEAFSAAGSVMSGIWDTVVSAMRPAVHTIGRLLADIPTTIGPWEIPGAGAAVALGNKLLTFRSGGLALGPGTGTSDSIVARLSNGEFITRAAMTARWLPILEAINAGAPPAEVLALLASMLPAFAGGGLVSIDQLRNFARGIEGAAYAWGGWGDGWNTDCSGAASALANYAVRQLPAGEGQRSGTGNMASFLGSLGAQPGLGPAGSLRWGWYNGGPYGGHIAMTLPTGDRVEMGGARGDGQFNGQAAGAEDPMFDEHMHLPPDFFLGGDLGGGGAVGGGLAPSAQGALAGAFSGGTGGSGGSGGSGGGTGASGGVAADTDAVRVYVVNMPAQGIAPTDPGTGGAGMLTGAGAVPAAPGTDAPGVGLDAANRWAADQDFPAQARDWAADALKEIFGQFTDPFGLKPLSDAGVDQIKTAAEALAAANAQPQPVVGQMIVNGNGNALETAQTVVGLIEERMTPVTGRYRNGG